MRLPWTSVAVISGLFSVMVAAAMLANLAPLRTADPLRGDALTAMKGDLALRPKDEALKTTIREHDAVLRSTWFERVGTAQRGAWLLLLGFAVTVAALKLARRQDEPQFDPRAVPPPDPLRAATPARWGLAVGGLALIGGLAVLGAGHVPTAPTPVAAAPQPPPGPEEIARNWPGFRGPAAGFAASAIPLTWDGAAGTNVLWKCETPLPGISSPVVWGDTVYVSGSDGKTQELTAYAVADGAKRWSCRIPVPPGAVVDAFSDTGHAAPTPATDGRQVIVLFASGALAAVSPEGRLLWTRALGVPDSQYSLASSPMIWRDRVLVQYDQSGPDDGRSAMLAFDLASGRQLWRTARPVGASWTTPLVAELAGRTQVLTSSIPLAIAYDPNDGRELWRAKTLSTDASPSPTIAGGLVVIVTAASRLSALRADGSGDVTASHLAWSGDDNLPDMASPLGDDELLVLVGMGGAISCHDAKDGAKLWEDPGNTAVRGTPVVAGGRLYVTDETGVTRILAWGRTLEKLGGATLGETISASPAVVGGRLFLRGDKHLFCIGTAP